MDKSKWMEISQSDSLREKQFSWVLPESHCGVPGQPRGPALPVEASVPQAGRRTEGRGIPVPWKWKSILKPEDKTSNVIPYVLKNYEKLGLKVSGDAKKMLETVKKLSSNFKKIEKEFS